MARKKTTIQKVDTKINNRFDQVKEVAGKANNYIYETSEDIVDGVIKRGTEWQDVSEKAIKGGLKLAANQQDLIFDTLEVVKGQFVKGRKRFSSLFSKN